MKDNRLHGIYVVTEAGCLDPHTGAAQHIKIGIRELREHFSIEPMFCETSSISTEVGLNRTSSSPPKITSQNTVIGSLRDIKYFLKNVQRAFSLAMSIRSKAPDFVYVRAHFLDPLPLLLKAINMPCFVEANGLQFESRRKYYSSFLTSWNRKLESWIYASAKHVFFVGSYGDYWQLEGKNWTNVENGVESDFVRSFKEHYKTTDGKIHIAIIARLMAHHRPQLLISAIKNLDTAIQSQLCLHLIGCGLALIKDDLRSCIEVVDHGFLSRDDLPDTLRHVHAGIIPGVPEYQSQMKLFDYGAAKCVALVPRTHNLQHWFDESEVKFFELNNPDSLSQAIEQLIANPMMLMQKGEKLHQRISNDFTWDKVFTSKAKVIQSCLSTS